MSKIVELGDGGPLEVAIRAGARMVRGRHRALRQALLHADASRRCTAELEPGGLSGPALQLSTRKPPPLSRALVRAALYR